MVKKYKNECSKKLRNLLLWQKTFAIRIQKIYALPSLRVIFCLNNLKEIDSLTLRTITTVDVFIIVWTWGWCYKHAALIFCLISSTRLSKLRNAETLLIFDYHYHIYIYTEEWNKNRNTNFCVLARTWNWVGRYLYKVEDTHVTS